MRCSASSTRKSRWTGRWAKASASWREWGARSPFERAAALERVAELIVERRDELARTLTLDQGKPLHAEAGLEALVVATYQAVSGSGVAGVEELFEQIKKVGDDAPKLTHDGSAADFPEVVADTKSGAVPTPTRSSTRA